MYDCKRGSFSRIQDLYWIARVLFSRYKMRAERVSHQAANLKRGNKHAGPTQQAKVRRWFKASSHQPDLSDN
jgi:hypothetical protein